MWINGLRWAARAIILLLVPSILSAAPIVIDFEGLGDLEVITTQFPGVTFSNAIILTSGAEGGTLNEFDFPPNSGVNAATDSGGSLSINFLTSVLDFGALFTYTEQLTIQAFSGGIPVAIATSASDINLEFLGGTPNEFIQLSFPGGFSQITISGSTNFGNWYTMDDATFTLATSPTQVPVPSTLSLIAGGLILLRLRRRDKKTAD